MIDVSEGTIILDVDGPLTPCDEEAFKIVRPGTTEQEFLNNKDWDVFKLLSKKELNAVFKLFNTRKFWLNLPPKETSVKMVRQLREEGNKILFCTSPWENCRQWSYLRTMWLKKHFDAKGRDDIIITAAKEYVQGDAFIDDKPANVLNWRKKWSHCGGMGVLFETLANRFDETNIYPRIVENNGIWEIRKEK